MMQQLIVMIRQMLTDRWCGVPGLDPRPTRDCTLEASPGETQCVPAIAPDPLLPAGASGHRLFPATGGATCQSTLWKIEVKVWSYIAQYPVHWTAQNTLHFTPWQTCSFRHQLNFSGKHLATQQLLREDYSVTFPPPSIARYSFLQRTGASWRERKCPTFETGKGDSNPSSLDWESAWGDDFRLRNQKRCDYVHWTQQ